MAQQREIPGFQLTNSAQLAQMDFPPLRFAVEGLLPLGGAAIIAAPPKSGKSFLCQDFAVSVALGRPVLNRNTMQGTVLYLTLEDGLRRVKERQARIYDGMPFSENLHYADAAERINDGLQEQIRGWKAAFPDGLLVVVDIFQRVRPAKAGRQDLYELDYEAVASLNDLGRELEICILIVHHTRKMGDNDNVFQTISGTNGLFAAVTVAMILERNAGDPAATLQTTGKDIDGEEIRLRFNPRNLRFDREDFGFFSRDPVVLLVQREVERLGGAWEVFPTAMPEAARRYPDLKPLHTLDEIRIGAQTKKEMEKFGIVATRQRNKPWYFSRVQNDLPEYL